MRELPLDRIESLEIVVDRRAHVQVELGDPAAADEFALLDDEGSELELSAFAGNSRREGMRQPIRAGRSEVVAGTDRARALVLFKGGLEVARLPVTLVPGETSNVRFRAWGRGRGTRPPRSSSTLASRTRHANMCAWRSPRARCRGPSSRPRPNP